MVLQRHLLFMIVIKAASRGNSSLFQTFYDATNGRGILFPDHTGKKAAPDYSLLLLNDESQTVTKGKGSPRNLAASFLLPRDKPQR